MYNLIPRIGLLACNQCAVCLGALAYAWLVNKYNALWFRFEANLHVLEYDCTACFAVVVTLLN